MSRTQSFLKGFASTTVQKLLTKLIGLTVTPIVLIYLNNSEYGIWIIIGSLLGYMGLMDFGVTGATTAIAAKSNTKEHEHRINTLINNSFALQCLIGLLIITVGFFASFYFPAVFNLGEYKEDDAWLVFIMAIVGYGISMPPKALKGLIRARQMIALAVWLEFALFIFTTSFNLYLLHLGFGLLALPIGTIVVRLLSYPLFIYFAKKAYPSIRFDLKVITLTNMKEIFGVSIYWFVGMIAAMIIYSTDTILIGMFISTAMVTSYALTYRLTEVIREFIYSINFNLMPGIGQIMGKGDVEKARQIYFRSQPIILSLAAVGAIFIYQFNSAFVKFWVGEEYFAGNTLSLIFAAILFVSVVFHASSLIISADLKLKKVTSIRLVEAAINIILSVILIQEYGLIGVAISTLIAALVTSFSLVPFITMQHLEIKGYDWLRRIALKTVGVFCVCCCVVILINMFGNSSVFSLITSILFYCMSSVGAIWFIALDKFTKVMLIEKFKR